MQDITGLMLETQFKSNISLFEVYEDLDWNLHEIKTTLRSIYRVD